MFVETESTVLRAARRHPFHRVLRPRPLRHRSRLILVMGVHGTGSSAVAGILHHLGVMMGEELVPADRNNPRGHFEDWAFRRLLYAYRSDPAALDKMACFLAARFKKYAVWGLKEPAIAEAANDLLPNLAGRDVRVIAPEREPAACVRSYLSKWPGTQPAVVEGDHAHLRGLRDRFPAAGGSPCLTLEFNEVTTAPAAAVARIAAFALEGYQPPTELQLRTAAAFVDPELNHRRELPPGAQ